MRACSRWRAFGKLGLHLARNIMTSAQLSAEDQDDHGHGKWRSTWRQVGILYGREFRAAVRDKTVVMNSILIPILLYPFLLWAGLSLLMFIEGQSETSVSKVGVYAFPAEHPRLRRALERSENLVIVEQSQPGANLASRIRNQEFDAFVQFTTNAAPGVPAAFEARITYDQTLDRSAQANQRFVSALENYRETWIKGEARKRGIDRAGWQVFGIVIQNVASKTQMGAFIMGLMLPILFAVMVTSGCFYPAVDTLAGERERGTWETLMSTAAQRGAILVAKYLHVVTFGGLAGMLNLAAVLLTIKPIMQALSPEAGQGIDLAAAWRAAPLMALTAVLLAGFIAAGMMVFAAFARTFKEGQAMVTPFYIVIMLPIVFLQVPGLQLSVATACIPVVNLILMMRAAVSGALDWLPVCLTILSSLGFIGIGLGAAAYILRFEEVATGAYSGNVLSFVRARLRSRTVSREVTR